MSRVRERAFLVESMNQSHLINRDVKLGWGKGPWVDEPDLVEWVDPASGLPCVVRREPRGGTLNGYVDVWTTHPLFGNPDHVDLDVHGGVTWAGPGDRPGWWRFGFDANHAGDLSPVYANIGMGVFVQSPTLRGEEYRTVEYMRQECERLAEQLAEIGKGAFLGEDAEHG